MENRGSWTPNTIAKFSPMKDVRPIKQNRYEPLSLIDRYKQINMDFDMERDGRLAMLEDQYQKSLTLRPEERISES
jgi:hypothetical protein